MSDPAPVPRARLRLRAWPLAAVAAGVGVLALAIMAGLQVGRAAMGEKLLSLAPDDVVTHRNLVNFAVAEGRPLFAKNCAACHGANMKGLAGTGAPNLTDQDWLYGEGDVFSIERTILYGIRSTHAKSHDVTEMPAFGLRGQLSDTDIKNVVQYMLQLSHRPSDAQAALAGREIYNGPASCSDCHGPDGEGNPDYGAPGFTTNTWLYGGDANALYNSVYYGHHGVMPAWIGKLSLSQIRALAVYVYVVSHPANAA